MSSAMTLGDPDCQDCEGEGEYVEETETEVEPGDPDWDEEADPNTPQFIILEGRPQQCHCCAGHAPPRRQRFLPFSASVGVASGIMRGVGSLVGMLASLLPGRGGGGDQADAVPDAPGGDQR